jgi:hypothetical protein
MFAVNDDVLASRLLGCADDPAAGGGGDVSVERVPYELQRGANQMMRIRQAARAHRA